MAYARTKKNYVNILEGRKKADVDDIMKNYPEGIHITGCAKVKGKNGYVGAFIFKENEKAFFFGGKVLTEMIDEWISEEGNGDINKLNEKLPVDLPVMKLMWDKSNSGNRYLNCEVIG